MLNEQIEEIIGEATFEFTMGESERAIEILKNATESFASSPAIWHTMAEIYFQNQMFDEGLEAGLKAIELKEDDIHYHTTLSRIYMEMGDKAKAEHHGARARVLGWKVQLNEETSDDGELT